MPAETNSKINILLGKDAYPATFLKGNEEISLPFEFEVEFLVPESFTVRKYPGVQVTIEFSASDGLTRRLAGLVYKIEESGSRIRNIQKKLIRASIVPRMKLLELHSDHRIMLGRTVVDILKETLERHGYKPEQLKFNLSMATPVHPYTLQVEESDLAFVHRVLARDGLFYYFDCETRDDATYEVIHFLDATSYCPYIGRKSIRYLPVSGLGQARHNKDFTSLYKIQENRSLQSGEWSFHDFNEQTPELTLLNARPGGTQGKLRGKTGFHRFGQGTLNLDEAERQARFAVERASVNAHNLTASGNIADVACGKLTSLEAGKFDPQLSADYLITRVSHHLDHRAAHDLTSPDEQSPRQNALPSQTGTGSPDYHCELTLINRKVNFRTGFPERPEIPLTFTARIESEGRYATLDAQGRYHLRKLLDMGDRPHTQATTPALRKMQPFGGPAQIFDPDSQGQKAESLETGMHFPLQDGDEVLLSCLNGDPDRPMIIGSVYDSGHSSPVNHNNHHQNLLRSKSNNEFLMDDKTGAEIIQLCTYEGFNILRLDANKTSHHLRLATEQGAMDFFAGETSLIKSGDSHEERSGNNRLQVVENKSLTRTNKGEIHYQTPTDQIHHASENIIHVAEKNIEIEATQNQRILVEEENMAITVEGSGGMRIHIKNDELHIQSAREVRIEGQGGGDITFHQSGGGLSVTKSGNVKLFGQDVQIQGSQGVTLSGNVSYSVTSPPPGPAPSPAAALQPTALNILQDPDAPRIINLAWDLHTVPVGKNAMPLFTVKNFKGNEDVTVRIYEIDENNKKTLVDTLHTRLDDGTGHHTLNWQSNYQSPDSDLVKQDQQDETRPLEFRFEVDIAGVREDEISPALWLTRDVEFTLDCISGERIEDETEVILYTSDNVVRYAYTQASRVVFEQVPVGSIRYLQITGYQHKVGTDAAKNHKDINSLSGKKIDYSTQSSGFVHARLVSRKQKPVCGVSCTLSAGGKTFRKQITNIKGEIYWPAVALGPCELTIELGDKNVTQQVPWLATGEQAHEQFVIELQKLTGDHDDTRSQQLRLAGLGYYNGRLDGIEGARTKKALQDFSDKQGYGDVSVEHNLTLAVKGLLESFGA